MSLLGRSCLSKLSLLAVAMLCGCDRGSPAYRHIDKLPHSQWDSYAMSLPVEERLDLHKEIMHRSGHNPVMTISQSFSDKPAETYNDLVKRISNGDRSRYYLSVIYTINRSPGFDMCKLANRSVIQSYLKDMSTDAVKPIDRPRFYSC